MKIGLIARLGGAAALVCSLLACNFGADGNGKGAGLASASQGDGGDTTDGEVEDTGIGTGIPMPTPTTGGDGTADGDDDDDGIGTLTAPTSTDDGDDSDDGTTGPGEGSAGEESTGPTVDMCDNPPFFKQVVTAGDMGVTFSGPMDTHADASLPGGTYFASEVEEQGIADFPWEAPCNDEYFLWARVWDDVGGASPDNDPDTYYVVMDEGGQAFWRYGCQPNFVLPTPSWYWVKVQEALVCLDVDPVSYTIDAGPHIAHFRNREEGAHDDDDPPGRIAAITRILITNDPNYVPSNTE